MRTVYLCQPDFQGILSGMDQAWTSGQELGHIHLALDQEVLEQELFTQYIKADSSPQQAQKVIQAVQREFSSGIYEAIYTASLSVREDRAEKMFRFLNTAFSYGRGIGERMDLPEVYDIFSICRRVTNESYHIREFIRFSQNSHGVLISTIAPENDVLILLAPYFSQRLAQERWVIQDEKREKALVHSAQGACVLVHGKLEKRDQTDGLDRLDGQAVYEDLWKTFFQAVSIRERYNPRCQRNLLPKRFRPYMTEFLD